MKTYAIKWLKANYPKGNLKDPQWEAVLSFAIWLDRVIAGRTTKLKQARLFCAMAKIVKTNQ